MFAALRLEVTAPRGPQAVASPLAGASPSAAESTFSTPAGTPTAAVVMATGGANPFIAGGAAGQPDVQMNSQGQKSAGDDGWAQPKSKKEQTVHETAGDASPQAPSPSTSSPPWWSQAGVQSASAAGGAQTPWSSHPPPSAWRPRLPRGAVVASAAALTRTCFWARVCRANTCAAGCATF